MNTQLPQFKDTCKQRIYCNVCLVQSVSPTHRAAWRKRYQGVPDDDIPCLFGASWIVEDNGMRGLGDAIAAVTDALGIPKCDGCAKRQVALNKAVPFK